MCGSSLPAELCACFSPEQVIAPVVQRVSVALKYSMTGDEFDSDEDFGLCDETCSVWSLRLFAVGFLLAGMKGVQVYQEVNEELCRRTPAIIMFWQAVCFVGSVWLVLDVVACFFLLRLSWLRKRVAGIGRMFSCSAWISCIFGLTQYSMQITDLPCRGAASFLLLLVLVMASVIPLLWWAFTDCDNMCSNCGEAGYDACCGGLFEVPEWPAADDPAEEVLGDLELARPQVSASGSRLDPSSSSKKRGASEGSASSGSLDGGGRAVPAVLGRSHQPSGPRRTAAGGGTSGAQGTIRVMRGRQVLHEGKTRRSVKHWVQHHLDDERGVTVEDSREVGMLPSMRVARPASPESPPSPSDSLHDDADAVGSSPPSPALTPQSGTPRGQGSEDSDSNSPRPVFGRDARSP